MKKLLMVIYFNALYYITEVFDIAHILSYIIAFFTGLLVAILYNRDLILYAVLLVILSITLNEFYNYYFDKEPEVVIVSQLEGEPDEEFMKKLGDTIRENSK